MLIEKVDPVEIRVSLVTANKLYIATGVALMFINVFVQFAKWRYVLSLIKPGVSGKESLYSLLVGFTFGFITPGRIGEFGRAFFVKDCHWMQAFGGAAGLLLILGHQLHFYAMLPIVIFTIIALLMLRYVLVHPELFRAFLYNLNIMLPFREKIKLLISSFDNFHRHQALRLLGLSVLLYLIILAQYQMLLLAFEPIHPYHTFQGVSSMLLVKSMLPISLGDLGIRESAAIFFLGKLGTSKAAAFNASILIFVINVLTPSLVGLALVLKNRLINWYEPS